MQLMRSKIYISPEDTSERAQNGETMLYGTSSKIPCKGDAYCVQ